MTALLTQWRALLRSYADEVGADRRELIFDLLLGAAASAVVLLDLVAIAAVGGGR